MDSRIFANALKYRPSRAARARFSLPFSLLPETLSHLTNHLMKKGRLPTMYSEKPKGKYWFQVCTDLPCALKGADEFYRQLCELLGVEDGGTTEDGLFTVEQVMCLAACDKAPMMQCNFHYHENLDLERVKALVEQLRAEAAADQTAE